MTMVQLQNEKSQQNVMQAGGLLLLCDNFMNDSDAVARTKGSRCPLMSVGSLISVTAFMLWAVSSGRKDQVSSLHQDTAL